MRSAGLICFLMLGALAMQALPAAAQTNLALNKPVLASSTQLAGVEPQKAVDGLTGTRWSSAFSDPQWILVDLGASYSIGRVRLNWEAAYAKEYYIQASNDGANWTTLYSTSSGQGGTNDLTGLSGSGRYVRMYGSKRGTSWGYSLWEFEVYASSSGGPGGSGGTGVKAVSAYDFLNSVSVNTHISQGIDQPAQVSSALLYAGFRNIRDDGQRLSSLIDVYKATGAKVALIGCAGDVSCAVSRAETLAAAGALLAVEGPNEPNNFPVTYGGKTSGFKTTFLPVAWFQRDLYTAVKASPKLAGIPVFASSEAGGAEPDNAGLQYLTIPAGAGTLMPDGTKYADFANTHNYVLANGFTAVVNNNAWGASAPGAPEGPWDGPYYEYGRTWHKGFTGYSNSQLETLPKVSTETGWFTSGTNAISEDQQGKLFLNLYLAAYKRGWKYTFIYMLRDDPVQGYWGLFRTDYSPKLSAKYLHNLTTILADTISVTPGSLNYSIPSQPATVHDLLIQKSDGTFELAVWNERTSGSDTVTVNLGRTFALAAVYDPTRGTASVSAFNNVSSVQLTLSDHPVIIEVR
jgi:hypothetical protein